MGKRKIAAFITAAGIILVASANISAGQPLKDGSASEANPEFSVPIRIIPDPRQQVSDRAEEEKDKRAERREDENLSIQRSVAQSSEEVAGYASSMYYLGVLGLLLSVVTVGASSMAAWFALGSVREARSATSVAREALSTTQDTAKKQLRAYVVLDAAEIPDGVDKGMLYAVLRIKNYGQTPAKITHLGCKCMATTSLIASDFVDFDMPEYTVILGPGGTITFHAANTLISMNGLEDAVRQGRMQIGASIRLRYLDIYNDEHEAQFTRTIETARNLHGGLGVSLSYPDSISS